MNPPNPSETPTPSPVATPKAEANASGLKSRLLEWIPVILSLLICATLFMPWILTRPQFEHLYLWDLQAINIYWAFGWLIPTFSLATLVARLRGQSTRLSAVLTGLIPLAGICFFFFRNPKANFVMLLSGIDSGLSHLPQLRWQKGESGVGKSLWLNGGHELRAHLCASPGR